VRSSAQALLGIINDLLDFSKIDANRIELVPAEFALRPLLDETFESLGVGARRKGLRLRWHVGADVPDRLVGDSGRLRQVLVNLVGNAVKFTERGEVEVSVVIGQRSEVKGQESEVRGQFPGGAGPGLGAAAGGDVGLVFSVCDTGIGIPEDKREAIFAPFEQGDNSTARRYGGTGLGLAIASRLVALMGGRITVESEPGRGSTFRFTARFGKPAEGGDAPRAVRLEGNGSPAEAAVRPLRVLVAEDNEFNQLVARELLERRGHRVRVVADGSEALAALEEEPFDALLLDVHMPGLDGFAVVRSLREREKQGGGHLAVIGLTARSMEGDRERAMEVGMDEYLAKPVAAADLYAALGRVAGGELIDAGTLLAVCGEDDGLLRTMVDSYRANVGRYLEGVRGAVAAGDAVRLREAAHKLKGLVATFSRPAAEAADALERAGESGQFAGAAEELSRLEGLARELGPALASVSVAELRGLVSHGDCGGNR
jgi:CheY-like chemotaxis protein